MAVSRASCYACWVAGCKSFTEDQTAMEHPPGGPDQQKLPKRRGWLAKHMKSAHPCQPRCCGQSSCLVHWRGREPLRRTLALQGRALMPALRPRSRQVQTLRRSLGRLMRGIRGLDRRGLPPRPAETRKHATRLCTLHPLATAGRTLSQQATSRRLPGRPLQRRESCGDQRPMRVLLATGCRAGRWQCAFHRRASDRRDV